MAIKADADGFPAVDKAPSHGLEIPAFKSVSIGALRGRTRSLWAAAARPGGPDRDGDDPAPRRRLAAPGGAELRRELGPETVLGRVVHPQTFAELEVIRTPYRRNVTILVHRTADVVEPGSYRYMIGNLESAAG
jgi:hypothetical protein